MRGPAPKTIVNQMRLWIDNASAALRASASPVLGAAMDGHAITTGNESDRPVTSEAGSLIKNEQAEDPLDTERMTGGSASVEMDDAQSMFAGNVDMDVHPPSMFGSAASTLKAGAPTSTNMQLQPETALRKRLAEDPHVPQQERVAMERRLTHSSLQSGLNELQLSLKSDRSVLLMQHQQSNSAHVTTHGLPPKTVQYLGCLRPLLLGEGFSVGTCSGSLRQCLL